jgi:hypothetical protein
MKDASIQAAAEAVFATLSEDNKKALRRRRHIGPEVSSGGRLDNKTKRKFFARVDEIIRRMTVMAMEEAKEANPIKRCRAATPSKSSSLNNPETDQ